MTPSPGNISSSRRARNCIGRYQSEVSSGRTARSSPGTRIIFPDGASIVIPCPALRAGRPDCQDRTDHHWDRLFAAAGLATLLGIGAEAGNTIDGDIERAIRRGTSDTINKAGQRAVDRSLSIQPTIRIRARRAAARASSRAI